MMAGLILVPSEMENCGLGGVFDNIEYWVIREQDAFIWVHLALMVLSYKRIREFYRN